MDHVSLLSAAGGAVFRLTSAVIEVGCIPMPPDSGASLALRLTDSFPPL